MIKSKISSLTMRMRRLEHMKSRGDRIRGEITRWRLRFRGYRLEACKERLMVLKKLESQIKWVKFQDLISVEMLRARFQKVKVKFQDSISGETQLQAKFKSPPLVVLQH